MIKKKKCNESYGAILMFVTKAWGPEFNPRAQHLYPQYRGHKDKWSPCGSLDSHRRLIGKSWATVRGLISENEGKVP